MLSGGSTGGCTRTPQGPGRIFFGTPAVSGFGRAKATSYGSQTLLDFWPGKVAVPGGRCYNPGVGSRIA